MSHTQKALLVKEIGKPVVLVDDWPVPEPGPDQVQLKVTVAGLNPHDQKCRDWGLFVKEHLPGLLTHDVAGIVTKLGSGVKGIAVGDHIVSHAALNAEYLENGLQEYAVADTGALAKLPAGFSDDDGATLPTCVIASLVGLFDALPIPAPWFPAAKSFDYANTTLLIIGGGANCGRYAVQLAKIAGVGKIVVVGGDEAELKGYGATHVLDRHGGNDVVLQRIKSVVGDDLIYALDTISDTEGQLIPANALSSQTKGTLARLIPLAPLDESRVTGKKAGFEVKDVLGSSQVHPELCAPFWSRIPEYLKSGKIVPLKYAVKDGLTPENVNEVLDAYRDGKKVPKVNIHV